MKKWKQGFTMVELLAVIAILGIIMGIAIPGVTQYLQKARKQEFETLEDNMKVGIDNYFIDHSSAIPAINGTATVSAQTLINEGYLDNLKDPDGGDCDAAASKVTVTRKGDQSDFNMTLNYKICVICSRLKSSGC